MKVLPRRSVNLLLSRLTKSTATIWFGRLWGVTVTSVVELSGVATEMGLCGVSPKRTRNKAAICGASGRSEYELLVELLTVMYTLCPPLCGPLCGCSVSISGSRYEKRTRGSAVNCCPLSATLTLSELGLFPCSSAIDNVSVVEFGRRLACGQAAEAFGMVQLNAPLTKS